MNDEVSEEEAPDLRLHFLFHGMAVLGLLVSGAIPSLAIFSVGLRGMKELLELAGIALPWPTEAMLSGSLHVVGPVFGVLAAGAVAFLSTLRRPGLSLLVMACAFLVSAPMAALGTLHSMAMRYALVDRLDQYEASSPLPEPGKTSDVARQVVEAVREGLARGRGSFTTPAGQRVEYFFLSGFDLPAPPAAIPPYAEARKHPGCVLLPFGPEGSTSSGVEEVLIFPHGVEGGIGPGEVDALTTSSPAWTLHTDASTHFTEDHTPAVRFPGTVPVSSTPGYSFSLTLKRARSDTSRERSQTPNLDLRSIRAGSDNRADDAFSDDLLELRVCVFRDFDPSGQPAPGSMTPVPWSNVPAQQFNALVSR